MGLSAIETRDGYKFIDRLDVLKELDQFVQEMKELDTSIKPVQGESDTSSKG